MFRLCTTLIIVIVAKSHVVRRSKFDFGELQSNARSTNMLKIEIVEISRVFIVRICREVVVHKTVVEEKD